MILYPAIDLKDGNAVRLLRGDMDKSTVFNTDPAAQAREFVDAGCEWLHLVDLNGAFEGNPSMPPLLRRFCPNAKCPRNWAAASAIWQQSKTG